MEEESTKPTTEPDTAVSHESMCLEIIDIVRQRKARPDLERISNLAQRRHGLTFQETEAVLERLVEAGQVIKVDYKGDISYRNALKWRKSHQGGNVLNAKSTSRRIIDAIIAIVNEDTTRPGASLAQIETWIAENCTVSDLTSKGLARLDVALNREVDIGRVVKLPDGLYAIGDLNAKKSVPHPATDVKSPNSSFGGFESKVIKRARKKKTKSFDPADIERFTAKRAKLAKLHWKRKLKLEKDGELKVEKRDESVHVETTLSAPITSANDAKDSASLDVGQKNKIKAEIDSTSEPVHPSDSALGHVMEQKCDYCLQYSGLNPNGPPEDLLICEDCNAKAHPSCMNYSEELARRALSSPWQCIDCKTCCICTDADDAAEMLFCDACDKGYHMKCHRPPIVDKPSGKWVCSRCTHDACEPGDVTMNAVSRSPYSDYNGNHTKSPAKRKPEVTMDQAMAWSVDDVAKYITELGYPQHAENFRREEIDGQSLLLMKRSDILTGLSLKLGPALKIHKHVSALQIDALTT